MVDVHGVDVGVPDPPGAQYRALRVLVPGEDQPLHEVPHHAGHLAEVDGRAHDERVRLFDAVQDGVRSSS